MHNNFNRIRPRRFSHRALSCAILLLATAARGAAKENETTTHSVAQIRTIVQELCGALSMQQNIQVSIAPHNERMVSVEHLSAPADAFVLSFDQEFLNSLTDVELTASIAHELGHVWIFTHHPYLQLEPLANEIAMRVVSRENLIHVYTKLWTHLGTEGTMSEVLGPETSSK